MSSCFLPLQESLSEFKESQGSIKGEEYEAEKGQKETENSSAINPYKEKETKCFGVRFWKIIKCEINILKAEL